VVVVFVLGFATTNKGDFVTCNSFEKGWSTYKAQHQLDLGLVAKPIKLVAIIIVELCWN